MKSAILKPQSNAKHRKIKDRIARWISFVALVALLAMATLPLTSGLRTVAVQNSTHWSDAWHG
jgi:cell division septal protein FtsQ